MWFEAFSVSRETVCAVRRSLWGDLRRVGGSASRLVKRNRPAGRRCSFGYCRVEEEGLSIAAHRTMTSGIMWKSPLAASPAGGT
jgi:hypothetical protein